MGNNIRFNFSYIFRSFSNGRSYFTPLSFSCIALPVITKFAVEVYAKVLALLVLLEKDGAPGVVVALVKHTSNTNSSPTQKYKRLK